MKKLITVLTVASMMVTPVAAQETARNYNVVDPAVAKEQITYENAPIVQTAPTHGTDPTNQRYIERVKKPGKPAPEFWYLLAAGIASIAFFAIIDKGPNHGSSVGQAGVNRP